MPKMRLGWYAGVSKQHLATELPGTEEMWTMHSGRTDMMLLQVSTALAGSVVISAFHQRPNFYSAMVYLSQSNFCLLVRPPV